jgi:fructosamine-3-kinase
VDSSDSWLGRLAEAVGATAGGFRPLGGRAWRLSAGGRQLVAKSGAGVLDEAEGLRRLAGIAGAPPVPEVVLAERDLLVTAWVEQAGRTHDQEEALGRMLAHLHSAPWPEWGGGSSWIGECPVESSVSGDATAFYGGRLLELASRCGLEGDVAAVVARLSSLLPAGEPSLLHGDLGWGNVLWGADGRPWLIDPSVHGGCPEEDLAMLALFGALPRRLLEAYQDMRPLPPGWEERVALFQLYPLLVHTVLFGGSYRERAQAGARHYA